LTLFYLPEYSKYMDVCGWVMVSAMFGHAGRFIEVKNNAFLVEAQFGSIDYKYDRLRGISR